MKLWASYWDGHPRKVLRWSLFAMATFEFTGLAIHIATTAGDRLHYGASSPFARALAPMPWVAFGMWAFVIVGIGLVATDRAPIRGGALALSFMSLMSYWKTEVVGSPPRNAFFVGAALLGWTVGQAWARECGESDRHARERLAEAGTLGCLAAAYVASAISKLSSAGLDWVNPTQIRALVLAQEAIADWDWLMAYRELLIEDPRIARAAAGATLIIEGGGFLLLFGPRLRLLWATLIFGMHFNIILLCTMPYIEPMFFMLMFAVPWPAIVGMRRIEERPITAGMPRAIVALLVGIVIAAWLLEPLGWRAYTG